MIAITIIGAWSILETGEAFSAIRRLMDPGS